MWVMGTQVLQEQQAASNLSTDSKTFLNAFICFASLSLTYRTHDLVFSNSVPSKLLTPNSWTTQVSFPAPLSDFHQVNTWYQAGVLHNITVIEYGFIFFCLVLLQNFPMQPKVAVSFWTSLWSPWLSPECWDSRNVFPGPGLENHTHTQHFSLY